MEDERRKVEFDLSQLDKKYKEGELTKRGFRKRTIGLQLKLLELDYNEGDVTEQGYAKKKQKLTEELQSVTVATVGDVTEQGYAKKKQKLTEELQSVTVATVADTSGFSEAKELEDFRTRMSTGLLKLYGRDRNAIKAAASTPSTAKKEDKWYKYDVYCLQKECTDIPRGNARTSIPKAVIEFRRGDTEDTIRRKVHLLFPGVFKDSKDKQYHYLKVSSNKLVRMVLPPTGHTSWTGSALLSLCGQGSMYIQPLFLDMSMEQKSANAPSVNLSTNNATYFNSVIAQGLLNFMKMANLPSDSTHQKTDVATCTSPDLETDLKKELQDPHVGGLILELSDLKQSKKSPSQESEPGYTFLYSVNPGIYFYCDWRRQNNRALKWNKDDYFIRRRNEKLDEFLEFKSAKKLFSSETEKSGYLVPFCSIVCCVPC